MAAQEGGDEYLVFEVELTEGGDLDVALDGQPAIPADHAFDAEWTMAIQAFGF